MGLFSFFKNKNNINVDVSKINTFVYPQNLKGGKIKLESTVFVPENYTMVIGGAGRALDTFDQKEVFFSIAALPKCCSKLKIHKTDSDGKTKKSFKADMYFVSKNANNFYFETMDKAELGSRANGIFTVGLNCDINFTIFDAQKFVDVLLEEYGYLKNNDGEKVLRLVTSELVVNILFKYNFALSEFLLSNKTIEDTIFSQLSLKYRKLGLSLNKLENIRYLLPKKYVAEYESNLQKLNAQEQTNSQNNEEQSTQEKDDQTENTLSENAEKNVENNEQILNETNVENTQNLKQKRSLLRKSDDNEQKQVAMPNDNIETKQVVETKNQTAYVPFGEMIFEDDESLKQSNFNNDEKSDLNDVDIKQEENKFDDANNNQTTLKEDDDYTQNKQQAKDELNVLVDADNENLQNINNNENSKQFVDLNLDHLYNKTKVKKNVCANCGNEVSDEFIFCPICGNKLKGE